MSGDLTLTDLADQVLTWSYNATKTDWGTELLTLAEQHELNEAIRDKTIATLGGFVSNRKATLERARKIRRLTQLGVLSVLGGVAYNGRPITSTISVRGKDGGRQLPLWTEATPAQFLEAVFREQAIIDGRDNSNSIRLELVQAMTTNDALMALPTMLDVCAELNIEPDLIGLTRWGT